MKLAQAVTGQTIHSNYVRTLMPAAQMRLSQVAIAAVHDGCELINEIGSGQPHHSSYVRTLMPVAQMLLYQAAIGVAHD